MSTTALILLDLQNEMVDPHGKVGAHGLARIAAERNVLKNAKFALEQARARGMKVFHVRLGFRADYADCLSVAARISGLKNNKAAILGEWGTEFPSEVAPIDGEVVVTKQCVNPFFNTGLMNQLFRAGVSEIAFGGVATNLVVEATARAADDAGFKVNVLEDICAAPNDEMHAFSIQRILPMFGTVTTTTDFFQA